MRRSKGKQILASVLIAAMVGTGIPTSAIDTKAATNAAPDKPDNLRTELLREAYGIDTKNPAFSWVVNDIDNNEYQTAYRIVVSETSALEGNVYDTDWVTSGESSFVHVDALESKLEDNEMYYWQVQTKDASGAESPLSNPAVFMTDVASEWQSLNGIWAVPGASTGESEWRDYIVEQTLSITGTTGKMALLVRMQSDKSGYMAQLSTSENVINLHQISSGSIGSAFKVLNLSESGITLPKDGSSFKCKITAEGSKLSFAIDTGAGYINANDIDISNQGNYTSGKIGYRTATWSDEAGLVEDIDVTSLDGETVLYKEDFTDSTSDFGGCTVSNGALVVSKDVFTVVDPADGEGNYTIEQKMSITGGNALAVLLRITDSQSGYMAQYRTDDQVIKIHKINDNASIVTDVFQTISLSNSGITLPTDGSEFGTKIELKDSEIIFYVQEDAKNGKTDYIKAGTVNVSAQGNILEGTFGYRTGRSESGTIDDMLIMDANGNVIFTSDFSEGADGFSTLSTSNGKLVVGNSVFATYAEIEELSNFAFIRSPKISIIDKDKIDKAIISAASRGTGTDRTSIFDLFFNGENIGAGSARELKGVGSFGGTSNFRKVYYNSYDVTELLVNGDANVISAVGNSRDQARSILIQMTVFYKDGTKEILTNSSVDNSGWKTLDGTKAFRDDGTLITTGYVSILHDNYDAEYYPTGWYEVDYDDSSWADAQVTFQLANAKTGKPNDGSAVLYPYSAENVLRREADEPTKEVYRNASGNLIVDLGKEIVGGLRVNINSNSKQIVTVRRGEEMNANGTVKYQLTAVPVYEDVWKLKAGSNQFETVTMRNFRYVELIGLDEATEDTIIANPDSLKGWAMEQAFDESVSAFEATDGSDAATLLNRLYDLSKYTIQATNQDVYTDSQARERAPYEGDLLVNSNTSYSVIDQYALARHSNEWLIDNPTWPNDYSLFSVEMAYWDYIYTGNTDSLKEYYNALKTKLTTKIEAEDSSTGLIRPKNSQAGNTALIDWPTSERDGYSGGYYDVILNAEYVGIYQCMAQVCAALGKTDDAEIYTAKSEKLKNALITHAYDETNGCFYDALNQDLTPVKHSSTHASAYALTYGVFKDQAMADRLCSFVYTNCKDQFKGSVYFTYFILKGLYNGNHGEYAERLITNPTVGTDVKTFASVLDNLNCTITPEAWGHKWKGNMTLSHPWGASPGCSIVQGMFGITPVKAGFEEFNIKLQPGGIASASVVAPSIKGSIAVSYENGTVSDVLKNAISVEVEIPTNTTAHVYIPTAGNGDEVLVVDGTEVEAKAEGTYLVTDLGSGTHSISVKAETRENLVKGKIADFTFDSVESGFASELAVAENSGSAVLSDDALFGKALSLNGNGTNYVTITDKDGKFLLKGCDEITVSYWSKTATTNGNHSWAFYAAPNDDAQIYVKENYLGILDNSKQIKAERYNSIGTRPDKTATLDTTNVEWKCVTVTYSTSGTTIYINGEKVAEDNTTYALTDILGANGVMYIGKANWGTGEYFTGLIDEFSIYNYALTETEVSDAYNSKAQLIEDVERDKAVAKAVEDLITAIGTVDTSEECKAKLEEVRTAYEDLTEAQKELVTNLATLEEAETTYANLKAQEEADKKVAQNVINLINQIGEVTSDASCKERIDAAQAAYDALTEKQKSYIDDEIYTKLTDAITAYNQSISTEADAAAAQTVMDLISQIGDVSTSEDCKTKIEGARAAYNALTEVQRSLVTNLSVLEDAEKTYADLKAKEEAEKEEAEKEQAAKDVAAAKEVDDKIIAIGTVDTSDDCKTKIEEVRAAYEALTEAQKGLVTNLAILEDAETTYADLKAKEEAVKEEAAKKEQEALEQAKKEQEAKEKAQEGTVSVETSTQEITTANTDKGDVEGSSFAPFMLKATGGKKSIKLTWKKISGAEGYMIYGAACGKPMKLVKTVSGNKKSQKITGLSKGKYYKYMIVAYKTIYGEKRITEKSVTVHAATNGGKKSNPTAITYKKSKITLKKGKTVTLKPKMKSKAKVSTHNAKFRYEVSDATIATVNKKGKIKGLKKGTCYVYMYTQNGFCKKVKLTIK